MGSTREEGGLGGIGMGERLMMVVSRVRRATGKALKTSHRWRGHPGRDLSES